MRPLDADPEFAGPFLEYFMGSWLQLLSAPYFWFVRGESVAFWFAARFKSTYRPGLAFACLVVTVALSLAWGINPTEGYILLALHSYSSMLVAIHYGFLSPGQRQRFLSFSGVAQLKARKAFTEDPMTTAEILSGQPLAGHFISLNGALLRLLAESTDGTAATVLVGSDASPDAVSGDALLHNADDVMRSMSRYVHIPHADGEPAAGASGGNISPHAAGKGPSPGLLADTGKERPGDPRVRDGAPAQLATNARLALPAYSEALLRAYAHMLADEEKDAHDAGLPRDGRAAADASTVAPGEASRASAGPAKPFHGSGDEGGRLSGRGGGKPGAAPGAQLSVTELGSGSAEEGASPPRVGQAPLLGGEALTDSGFSSLQPAAADARRPTVRAGAGGAAVAPAEDSTAAAGRLARVPGGGGPGQAEQLRHRRHSSAAAARASGAWGELGSFRPFRWTLPSRLVAKEIASRASSGASISAASLRLARFLALLAVVAPAVQFAVPAGCDFSVAQVGCLSSTSSAAEPLLVHRLVVFVVAAVGSFDSSFVIMRLMLRIRGRSSKQLQMLTGLSSMTLFSASLRARLPFVDLRLPENACQWVAALDALLGHYEARDNVNSVEILSTIMAWNAVVVLAALLAALLIALGVVRLQLQSLVSLGLWGLIMGVGLGFAFVSEASSNELLETLSRHLQHIRTVMAEEVTSLRQAAMSRKWRSMTEKRQRGQSTGQASGSAVARRIGSFAGLGATELLETVYSDDDSPRSQNDAKAAPRRQGGLLRPESKKDFLERRAQHAMSTAESAAGLSSEQQTALADTIGNAMTVLDGKINELASGASRSRLFGLVISFTLLRGFLGALLATMLSLLSFIFSNR
ncbi:hypothetical protein FNF31_07529 [Cafeteria roenbergensis]|uniref:Uncharacterized protein n=1 Tax=Cafeteria roenbergensis TaxID=33653 RepID=A0A5A8C479_CAFRO|nr:hypothetical protein FNF31_07529 [Cafeteria roenbergensis]